MAIWLAWTGQPRLRMINRSVGRSFEYRWNRKAGKMRKTVMNRGLMLMVVAGVMMTSTAVLAVDVSVPNRRDEDVNADIVTRCYYEMSEFGTAGMEMCIEADKKERQALAGYPDDSARIVDRCILRKYLGGWGRIRACVDADIAAREALKLYAPEHAALLAQCLRQYENEGQAAVKACVDVQVTGEGGETQ